MILDGKAITRIRRTQAILWVTVAVAAPDNGLLKNGLRKEAEDAGSMKQVNTKISNPATVLCCNNDEPCS
jgi:hypothetical protein